MPGFRNQCREPQCFYAISASHQPTGLGDNNESDDRHQIIRERVGRGSSDGIKARASLIVVSPGEMGSLAGVADSAYRLEQDWSAPH